MQLKEALARKGFKVRDLYERMVRRYAVDYQTVARYCRCSNRSKLDGTMWSWIDSTLTDMEVTWNERQRID